MSERKDEHKDTVFFGFLGFLFVAFLAFLVYLKWRYDTERMSKISAGAIAEAEKLVR